jgi:hypothetical protein
MYNETHWYWIVDGSTTQVWSSASFGYVAISDTAYQAWLASGNTPTKIIGGDMAEIQAEIAIDRGVAITSASTPSLNDTYAIGPSSQAAMNAVTTYILLNAKFPGSSTTQAWSDATGTVHVFPSTTVFEAFATAVADYVAAVAVYGDSRGSIGSLPSPSISII